jgi:hypothetical protein
MNLKESFRYQNFLENMLAYAGNSLTDREHSLTITKNHLRKKANAEAEDMMETVDVGEFFKNDDVLKFMTMLVEERSKLTNAIGKAKASIGFDLDAAIETNKFRQTVANRVKTMLRFTASKRTERGTDYKFNVEGNQTQYYYDIEVEANEAFDRSAAKDTMRKLILEADKVSVEIDSAMINTVVEYDAPFNVNDSFEDVMTDFLAKK